MAISRPSGLLVAAGNFIRDRFVASPALGHVGFPIAWSGKRVRPAFAEAYDAAAEKSSVPNALQHTRPMAAQPRSWNLTKSHVDCLIVGAGPAGLTAAIYLARFRLSVIVIDSGQSRAAIIPRTHNHAGFPEGIAGAQLLSRMRQQAALYGVEVIPGCVSKIHRGGDYFVAEADQLPLKARRLLLATGVTNRRPDMPGDLHDVALARGSLRYCPVCDGYEVTDQRVAVIGTGQRGVKEAEFLRSFTDDLTLVSPGAAHDLSNEDRCKSAALGIKIINGPVRNITLTKLGLGFDTAEDWLDFASIYPALGSEIHSNLASSLGAECTEEGCIRVDSHQQTSTLGLFAAGDVVLGLDQISHAMGEAGVAATAIRNSLAAIAPLMRTPSN